MSYNIIDRKETNVFLLNLESSKNKESSAIEGLRFLYPYLLEKKNIYVKKTKTDRYICFVSKNSLEDNIYVSSTLFAVNHFKKFTGKLCIELSGYYEYVTLENGNLVETSVTDVKYEKADLYVSENEILSNFNKKDVIAKKSQNQIRKDIIRLCVISSFVLVVMAVMVKFQVSRINNLMENQREIEKQNTVIIEEQKRALKQLSEYEKKYENYFLQTYEKVYPRLSVLYECIGKKSTIESISFEKDRFVIDVTTKDSLLILEKFESRTDKIKQVQMNRTTVQNGNDFVSYSGDFVHSVINVEGLKLEEKISQYKMAVEKYEAMRNEMDSISSAEYAKNIRSSLHKHSCNEQFMQYKKNQNILILNCEFKAAGKNTLEFIRDIESDNKVNILSLKIRNSSNLSGIQTSIQFWTGITVKDNDNSEEGFEIKDILPSEMSSVFYKSPEKVVTKAASMKTQEKKADNREVISKIEKNLSLVGQTKNSKGIIIILKDEEMGVLYKLPLVYENSNGDYCKTTDSGKYIAVIRNKMYGVNK